MAKKNRVVGADKALARANKLLKTITKHAEAAVYTAITMIENRALSYVPLDTGALMNSAYKQVEKEAGRVVGRIGYMQEYALPLNSPEPGGKMDGWQPRPIGTIVYEGKGVQRAKTAANMDAKQNFLGLGLQEAKPEIERALQEIVN